MEGRKEAAQEEGGIKSGKKGSKKAKKGGVIKGRKNDIKRKKWRWEKQDGKKRSDRINQKSIREERRKYREAIMTFYYDIVSSGRTDGRRKQETKRANSIWKGRRKERLKVQSKDRRKDWKIASKKMMKSGWMEGSGKLGAKRKGQRKKNRRRSGK